MWYNTQMKAKPPRNYSSKLRNNFQSSLGKEIVNPRERLMNTQKRQKLKELLIDRLSSCQNGYLRLKKQLLTLMFLLSFKALSPSKGPSNLQLLRQAPSLLYKALS